MIFLPQSLDKTKLSTGAICTAIIKDIERDSTVCSGLEAQARQVKEVLVRSSRAGAKHLLMIEEAHDLSITTLKYLKRFYEIESDDGFGRVLSIADRATGNAHQAGRVAIPGSARVHQSPGRWPRCRRSTTTSGVM